MQPLESIYGRGRDRAVARGPLRRIVVDAIVATAVPLCIWIGIPVCWARYDRELIVACHRRDVAAVKAAIRAGANVHARFGQGNANLLTNKWTLGRPRSVSDWTPLVALAHSSDYPDPPRDSEKLIEEFRDRDGSLRRRIPGYQMGQRERDRKIIQAILVAHGCPEERAELRGNVETTQLSEPRCYR
ncbi:MAG TPA: hypothetical protein VKU82_11405 [Planctomycetaceae bacterium]|nr:hypothetical protein [Planctomycetaceae bacterium]